MRHKLVDFFQSGRAFVGCNHFMAALDERVMRLATNVVVRCSESLSVWAVWCELGRPGRLLHTRPPLYYRSSRRLDARNAWRLSTLRQSSAHGFDWHASCMQTIDTVSPVDCVAVLHLEFCPTVSEELHHESFSEESRRPVLGLCRRRVGLAGHCRGRSDGEGRIKSANSVG